MDRFPFEKISADLRIWVTGHNRPVRRLIEPLLSQAVRPPTGSIDLALVVPETSEEWAYFSAKVLPRLAADGEVGLVLAEADAERRGSAHPLPASYHDAARALGLRIEGVWVTSPDLLIFRFVRSLGRGAG